MNAAVRRALPYIVSAALIVGFFGVIALPFPIPLIVGVVVAVVLAGDVRGAARLVGANARSMGSARMAFVKPSTQRLGGRAVGVFLGALTVGLSQTKPSDGVATGSGHAPLTWGFFVGALGGAIVMGAVWLASARMAAGRSRDGDPTNPEVAASNVTTPSVKGAKLDLPVTAATQSRIAAAVDILQAGVYLGFEVVGNAPVEPGLHSDLWAYRNLDGSLQVMVDRWVCEKFPEIKYRLGADNATSVEDACTNEHATYGGAMFAAAIMALWPTQITVETTLGPDARQSLEAAIASAATALGIDLSA